MLNVQRYSLLISDLTPHAKQCEGFEIRNDGSPKYPNILPSGCFDLPRSNDRITY